MQRHKGWTVFFPTVGRDGRPVTISEQLRMISEYIYEHPGIYAEVLVDSDVWKPTVVTLRAATENFLNAGLAEPTLLNPGTFDPMSIIGPGSTDILSRQLKAWRPLPEEVLVDIKRRMVDSMRAKSTTYDPKPGWRS